MSNARVMALAGLASLASPRLTAAQTSGSASVYTYFLPDHHDYVQPTLSVDHEAVHLEARYNYEDLATGSVWAGYTFSGGERWRWELTPMLGGVFGSSNGVAPGYRAALGFWKLELDSEGEYLFDLADGSNHFFYSWSELGLSPVEWFRCGVVLQRTRVFQSERELARGVLVGFSNQLSSVTAYVFNLSERQPTVVVALALTLDP
ncbi:MAG TPA: hypothetical protein VER04_05180 [Polyangiaceae bacterium]|nr:hypothetical protein [Polyangiaceae bacterium]